MRADLITIQQTLTPEAATVLNQSIAEATRRNHGHTTPLHVAATLLSSSSGFLRQACIKSHPNSSHPLQCRALELCFSVALERLPTTTTSQTQEPPLLSNALTAALKRAQAHQRRGCPEQQQQPLLAVKVELEQLIISILDDPSVSRVMREASFSSPAVKSAIEQSLSGNSVTPRQTGIVNTSSIGFGYRPVPVPVNRNPYVNPRLHQNVSSSGGGMVMQRTDEAKRVMEVMTRTRKRNPVLVGDSEPQILVKEILRKIETGELSDGPLRGFQVIRLENESTRFGEISGLVETRLGNSELTGGVVLDLGDLKWLAANNGGGGGLGAVVEMRKLLERYKGRLCFIGTATCETYLRCQVYYPSMENDCDLQAIPIAAKSLLLPTMFQRLGSNNSNTLLLNSNNISPTRTSQIPAGKMSCCPRCLQSYENDVAKLEKSLTGDNRSVLPQWLQNAKVDSVGDKKPTKDQEIVELQKKWNDLCLRLHPKPSPSERTTSPSSLSIVKPNPISDITPPGSPIGTDLVLGRSSNRAIGKLGDSFDIDLFKKLLKGLAKSVWWQHDAASSVASAITECKHGNGRSKGDIWLMFTGPDRTGKTRMASALSDLVSGGSQPITISVGSRSRTEDDGLSLRGKTALDRLAETVRRNPFAVIVMEDVDEADVLLRNNVKLAMERGRICDSYGREVSLGNVIIILTTDSSLGLAGNVVPIDETRLESLVSSRGWTLRLSVCNGSSTRKRKPNWLYNDETKQRKEICFDLNEAVEFDSSSDVTVEHNEQEDNSNFLHKLVALADDAIVFRPVDFGSIKSKTAESLKKHFGDGLAVEIEDEALERIAGAIWLSKISLEEWLEEAMGSSLNSVKSRVCSSSEDSVISIQLEDDVSDRNSGGYLPNSIRTVVV
ncbi:protein SMAX1-LIKE 2-like [Raphanus sativus]|uniref:Protein SMAX1-LIKE 2-like n=1 Tax=Raphanus sativus TaxID=3726 RepID=A0A9W3CT56_RAPSA|nr:protein SMAX1-LIKE 2-like [Raphanus sativus]